MTTTKEEKESTTTETIFSAAVGKKYERRFTDAPTSAPWLDPLPDWQRCLTDNTWTRWDGTTATAQEHMVWVRSQVKPLFDDTDAEIFRPYGQHDGCQFYIHDGLTKAGNGYGFFKIEGRVFDVQPRDILRICFDMSMTIDLDETAVFYKMMKPYTIRPSDKDSKKKNSMVFPVYWCNDPGFPFSYRDGVDLTGFLKDDDDDSNVIWQVAVGVDINDFGSQPGAIKATDRYWAYRLEPTQGGTKVSIICQCCLNGWIPKFLSNYFVCKVLTEALAGIEKKVRQMKADDAEGYEQKMKEMGLGDW